MCIKRVSIALSLALPPHMDVVSLARDKASPAHRVCLALGVLASKRVYAWRPIDETMTARATTLHMPVSIFCECVSLKAVPVRSTAVQTTHHATSLADDVTVCLEQGLQSLRNAIDCWLCAVVFGRCVIGWPSQSMRRRRRRRRRYTCQYR